MDERVAESAGGSPVAEQRSTVSGAIIATIFVVGVLAVVALVLGYFAALVVVKIGLPAPKLVVGLPLVTVLAMAWALAQMKKTREVVLAVLTTTSIAVALFAIADPPHPAKLFESKSELVAVDVDLERNAAELSVESKKELREIPGFGRMLVLALLLAASAYGLCAAVRPLYERHQLRKAERGF